MLKEHCEVAVVNLKDDVPLKLEIQRGFLQTKQLWSVALFGATGDRLWEGSIKLNSVGMAQQKELRDAAQAQWKELAQAIRAAVGEGGCKGKDRDWLDRVARFSKGKEADPDEGRRLMEEAVRRRQRPEAEQVMKRLRKMKEFPKGEADFLWGRALLRCGDAAASQAVLEPVSAKDKTAAGWDAGLVLAECLACLRKFDDASRKLDTLAADGRGPADREKRVASLRELVGFVRK